MIQQQRTDWAGGSGVLLGLPLQFHDEGLLLTSSVFESAELYNPWICPNSQDLRGEPV